MTDLVEFIEARLTEDERTTIAFRDGHAGPCINYEGQDPEDYSEWDSCSRHIATAKASRYRDTSFGLREVEAKRRILARHQPVEVWAGHDHIPPGQLGARMMIFVNCSSCIVNHDPEGKDYDCRHGEVEWPCPEVCDLAAAYADHPDYLTEWSPENVVPPE